MNKLFLYRFPESTQTPGPEKPPKPTSTASVDEPDFDKVEVTTEKPKK